MPSDELNKLKAWKETLEDVSREYPTSSVSNALMQINARIKVVEENKKNE
jgi:hypothetical protein